MRSDDFRRSDNVEDDRERSASRRRRHAGRRRRPRHRHGHRSRPDQLVPRHRSERADQRRANPQRRRRRPRSRPVRRRRSRPGTPTDATGKFVAPCSATPRTAGRRSSPPAARPIIRRSCGCSPAPSRRAAASRRSAMGPFYCPRDQRIYLDTSFFDDMQRKFGACSNSKACQFSEAYVIAHEVGHHVQNELGILPQVTQAQQAASSKAEANQLQVRVELQADCLAGVWANHAQQKHDFLDPGDVDQALQTASAIGDDRLQKQTQGYVVPDSFTHGTSEQRKRWF